MTTLPIPKKTWRTLPILGGILPIVRSRVPMDIIAGITLAALAIPEVMGYTKIAGMPVVTGLYTLLIPTVLFALFGSSRHLVSERTRLPRPSWQPGWQAWLRLPRRSM
jgi:MFS superfamily sulfate permease-like transporter